MCCPLIPSMSFMDNTSLLILLSPPSSISCIPFFFLSLSLSLSVSLFLCSLSLYLSHSLYLFVPLFLPTSVTLSLLLSYSLSHTLSKFLTHSLTPIQTLLLCQFFYPFISQILRTKASVGIIPSTASIAQVD